MAVFKRPLETLPEYTYSLVDVDCFVRQATEENQVVLEAASSPVGRAHVLVQVEAGS